MKVLLYLILTIFIFILFLLFKENSLSSNTKYFDIDFCLDKGYCWNYTQNHCEQKEQIHCQQK